MYTLKHQPEDFIVTELSLVRTRTSGGFLYFTLKKRDCSTVHALERIAQRLHISIKNFSYAGIKDRRAVSTQACSVYGTTKEALEAVQLDDIAITFLGYGAEPIHVGQLSGNRFTIIVRNIDALPSIKTRFRNLYGDQRFSERNAEIGRHIVKREFEKAALELRKSYPRSISEDRMEKKDWIGALRDIPRKQLLFFVHAYQSLLWNTASLETDLSELPIVGFGTTELDPVTLRIIRAEGVAPRDFVIKQIPELSAEGATRAVWTEAQELTIGELESDDCFPGKKKVKISFTLGKGCYATEFIRQQF